MRRQRLLLRAWLARHEKSQRWLALRVGISESQLSLVLQGKRTLTAELNQKVFAATGLKLRPLPANKAA